MKNKEVEEIVLTNANEEIDLEVVELEDKVAPRNWNIYALVYQ